MTYTNITPARIKAVICLMRVVFIGAAMYDWFYLPEHLVITVLLWFIWEIA